MRFLERQAKTIWWRIAHAEGLVRTGKLKFPIFSKMARTIEQYRTYL